MATVETDRRALRYTAASLGLEDGTIEAADALDDLLDAEAIIAKAEAAVGVDVDLSEAITTVCRYAEQAGAVQQRRVIQAALRGDLSAWPGCSPQWRNRSAGAA